MKNLKLEDIDAIKETVNLYIAGAKSGNSDLMAKAFHEEATIYGWMFMNADDLTEKSEVAGPIKLLYEFVNDTGAANNLQEEIVHLDVVGTSASVKLELYDWLGIQFTDTLNLIKKANNWRIVNKIFNQAV